MSAPGPAEDPQPATPSPDTAQLVVQAAEQLRSGELPTARALLEQAARQFGAQGDAVRQQWCTQVAASLARHQARRAAAGDQDPDDVVLAAVIRLVSSGQAGPGAVGAAADSGTAPPLDVASLGQARATALQNRDVAGYLTAAVAEALLADSTGDRIGAYRSLATAWVTLADLVGPAAAEQLVAPQLVNLRNAWGAEAFAEMKAGYETQAKQAKQAKSAEQVKEDVGG